MVFMSIIFLKGLVQDAQTPPKYKGTKLYKKQKNKTKGPNFNTNAEPKTTKPEKTHGWHSNQKLPLHIIKTFFMLI
jgi:hypothetical protein